MKLSVTRMNHLCSVRLLSTKTFELKTLNSKAFFKLKVLSISNRSNQVELQQRSSLDTLN